MLAFACMRGHVFALASRHVYRRRCHHAHPPADRSAALLFRTVPVQRETRSITHVAVFCFQERGHSVSQCMLYLTAWVIEVNIDVKRRGSICLSLESLWP